MGITIHYGGFLNDLNNLPKLVEELADIAESIGWEYSILNDRWDIPPDAVLVHNESGAAIKGNLGLRGITLQDPKYDLSLDFFFNRDGQLLSPLMAICVLDGSIQAEDACACVKTQFSSVENHIWIIGLLKYIQRNYIPELRVNWETLGFK